MKIQSSVTLKFTYMSFEFRYKQQTRYYAFEHNATCLNEKEREYACGTLSFSIHTTNVSYSNTILFIN